jgi:hypothetical protein
MINNELQLIEEKLNTFIFYLNENEIPFSVEKFEILKKRSY